MVGHAPAQQEARHERRVDLRPYADEDLERLRRTHTHLGQLDRAHVLGAFEVPTQACVGEVTLTVLARAHVQWADLGFGLFTPAQGRGLGPPMVEAAEGYAFDTLALHRVEAVVLPENTRSLATLARAGSELEGLRRAFHLNGDLWTDMAVYVRIRQNP